MSEPRIVELPNIPAEYGYIERLRCERCQSPVKGNRVGSGAPAGGRIHDFWTTECTRCGHTDSVILSVPVPTSGGTSESAQTVEYVWAISGPDGEIGNVIWRG